MIAEPQRMDQAGGMFHLPVQADNSSFAIGLNSIAASCQLDDAFRQEAAEHGTESLDLRIEVLDETSRPGVLHHGSDCKHAPGYFRLSKALDQDFLLKGHDFPDVWIHPRPPRQHRTSKIRTVTGLQE